MPDTTRPAPPPLIHRAPDCTLCTQETIWSDSSFDCYGCGVSWPDNPSDPVGEWADPDAERCPSELQPYGRCYLDNNHAGDFHLHPHSLCGWTTKQETSRAAEQEDANA